MFSKGEIDYMKSQRLARVATVNRNGQPDLVPVGFEFDGEYFWVGSHSQDIFLRTTKYKNVRDGRNKVSLVIDDLKSVDPWSPRCIKVYGRAEIEEHKGIFGEGKYLKIMPEVSWSMGAIDGVNLPKGSYRLKTVHTR
jgi:pyridoxamine 5'-phosphate oxidase family protein